MAIQAIWIGKISYEKRKFYWTNSPQLPQT